MTELGISYENVAIIGDDINDLPIIENVALSACPADAVQLVKNAVHIQLNLEGGKGCVREFIDTYLMTVG